MAVLKHDRAPFQPYARLMTMLGDQLITDKKVAIIELIKNCYDADATHVSVSFGNLQNVFFNDLSQDQLSFIEIKDDGCGMKLETIQKTWLRPATPNKETAKRTKMTTTKGRVIQGEKGIGRFAIHKLGTLVDLYTRADGEYEVKLTMDFTDYEPTQANLFNQQAEYKLLDEVSNDWYVNNPAEVITQGTGTVLRIYCLRETWSEKDQEDLFRNIQRLTPPTEAAANDLGIQSIADFVVDMYVDGKIYKSDEVLTFKDVIERAQFKMTGSFSANGVLSFDYKATSPLRTLNREVNLLDKQSMASYNYSSYVIRKFWEQKQHKLKCGPFAFSFYAFDLSKPDRTVLNKDLKDFIKDNFVYVLRDGVRVYPYGEKGIDWLSLDKLRATVRAGMFVSYNDLTGFVYITQKDNPLLKDSTNRQGLMEIDGAYEDFKMLVTAATEIFNAEMNIDKQKKELQKEKRLNATKDKLVLAYNELKNNLLRIDDAECLKKANSFVETYDKHLAAIQERMHTIQDLAGLGMAVERSSHDTLRLLSLMKQNIKSFSSKIQKQIANDEDLLSFMDELSENIDVVYDNLQLIQPLFKVQRQSVVDVSIQECANKVFRYFRTESENIHCYVQEGCQDVIVKTNTGLILQVLINLVDNALFWVKSMGNQSQHEIIIVTKPATNSFIIADDGPGIQEDVAPLIFQEFFSRKAQGRGLGLYIVQELLSRIGADIELIQDERDKVLSGANFVISFNQLTK